MCIRDRSGETASRRSDRASRAVAVVALLATVGVCVVRLSAPSPWPVSAYSLVAHNTSAGDIMFSKNESDSDAVLAIDLNCSEYNDDDVYTNDSCVTFDKTSCGMYCYEDSWCEHFCGDECKKGGGAICALQVLSNLSKSCEMNGLCSAPGKDTSVEGDGSPTPQPTSAPASASGCDHHAICTYCLTDDFCQELVLDGVIAAANMAMLLLSDFEQTCTSYGCDDWNGRRDRLLASPEARELMR